MKIFKYYMNILRRIFCCQRYYSSGVYRLQLEVDKIYVGKSNDIEKEEYGVT